MMSTTRQRTVLDRGRVSIICTVSPALAPFSLRAFTDDAVLRRMSNALDDHGYRTHEFGDSVFLERRDAA